MVAVGVVVVVVFILGGSGRWGRGGVGVVNELC